MDVVVKHRWSDINDNKTDYRQRQLVISR